MLNVEPSFVLYALLVEPGGCLRARITRFELVEPGQKKTKRFIIFHARKGVGGVRFFFDIFDPTPTPPPPPSKRQKSGFKWVGFLGVETKNSLGDMFMGQNNGFTRGLHKQFNPLR